MLLFKPTRLKDFSCVSFGLKKKRIRCSLRVVMKRAVPNTIYGGNIVCVGASYLHLVVEEQSASEKLCLCTQKRLG